MRTRFTAVRILAVLLALAQAFALLVAPIHRIAHAATEPVIAVAHASSGAHALPPLFDWFGHQIGANCDDWNAAFAHDINPGGTHAHVMPLAISLPVSCGRLPVPVASHPVGLSLARAPPRS